MPKLSGLIELRRFDVKDINPAKYNPRKDLKPDDPQYQTIRASLLEHGYIDPLVINIHRGANTVVGGHQRLKILIAEGITEVDASVVDLVTLAEEKALNIKLNNATGENDDNKLAEIMRELKADSYDITSLGIDDTELERLLHGLNTGGKTASEDDFDADAAAAAIENATTKAGDVWLLGQHRIMCGDATKQDDLKKLMQGREAQLVVTDPPYNVAYVGGTGMTIENDNQINAAFYKFLYSAYENMFNSMEPGASIYVFHADTEGINFRTALTAANFKLSGCCVWVKQTLVMGRSPYQWKHEPVLFGWKPGAAHKWYSDRKQTTVWEYDRPSKSPDHPTMKPVTLTAYPIENSSKKGDIVLDPFMGSGTTMIASEQTGRIAYGLELSEVYCDVIVQRWETLTGLKATLEVNE